MPSTMPVRVIRCGPRSDSRSAAISNRCEPHSRTVAGSEGSDARAAVRAVHVALLLAGAAGLALLVGQIGLRTLRDDALRLGWGAAIIVAVAALEHALHTAGWRRCFSRGRVPSWPRLFGAYLAGYAVSFATPTAVVGGELARGGVLLRDLPAVEVVSSITL